MRFLQADTLRHLAACSRLQHLYLDVECVRLTGTSSEDTPSAALLRDLPLLAANCPGLKSLHLLHGHHIREASEDEDMLWTAKELLGCLRGMLSLEEVSAAPTT